MKLSLPAYHQGMAKSKPAGKTITLLGEKCNLVFQSLKRFGKPGETVLGYCDPPTAINRTIWIEKSLDDEKRLEILLHEMTHFMDWHKDEDSYVAPGARDIARVLIEDGWRRTGG